MEGDNVLKSKDEEDAPVMYEDPSKLKVVADNIRMKSPGKIYINWAKINFKKRIDTVSRKHFNDYTDTKHSGNKFVCT